MQTSDLKSKTIKGFFWSFVENFLSQGVTFIVGIVLSRMLSPDLFGLVGMIMIFIAVSEIFVNSGFHQSLIRKRDVGPPDFSTIFFTNLIVAIFFWMSLFVFSPFIADFYNQPILIKLLPVYGVVILIDSLALVQKTDLTIRLDFKLLAKISFVSNLVGGTIGILAAYFGMGVWSLVFKSISQKIVSTTLLWMMNKWRPQWYFNLIILKEHFAFGSKLLISGIIDSVFANIYYLVIGKYFSILDVGYYSRADQFQKLPSSNLSGIISRVSYPVLSKLSDNIIEMRRVFEQILIGSTFLVAPIMLTLAAISDTFVVVLIGEEWLPSAVYLKLLCFIGAFYPIHHINLLIPQIFNRTDIFLRLEIIKKSIVVLIVLLGIKYGIQWMLMATLAFNVVAFFLHAYWTFVFIQYSIYQQIKQLIPPMMLGVVVLVAVQSAKSIFIVESPFLFLLFQCSVALLGYFLMIKLFFKSHFNSILLMIKNSKVSKTTSDLG